MVTTELAWFGVLSFVAVVSLVVVGWRIGCDEGCCL